GLLAYATAMVNWHRAHPHCARCGAVTHIEEAGFLRRCPACGAEHHPRTDPVVIMLVHDGDRAMLGARGIRRAGREPRGGGGTRGARGVAGERGGRELPVVAAVAVPGFA